jgi:hypothetical protein
VRDDLGRTFDALAVEHVIAGQLFLRFREWPVRDRRNAVSHANRLAGRRIGQRLAGAEELPGLGEFREKRVGFPHQRVTIARGESLESPRVVVDKRDVLHVVAPFLEDRSRPLSRSGSGVLDIVADPFRNGRDRRCSDVENAGPRSDFFVDHTDRGGPR